MRIIVRTVASLGHTVERADGNVPLWRSPLIPSLGEAESLAREINTHEPCEIIINGMVIFRP